MDSNKKDVTVAPIEPAKTEKAAPKPTLTTIVNVSKSTQTLIDSKGNGIYVPVGESVQVETPLSKDIRRVERLGLVQIVKK